MSVTVLVMADLEAAGIAAGKGGATAAGGGAAKFAWAKVFDGKAKAAGDVIAMAMVRAIEESTPGSDDRSVEWWTRAGQRLIKPFVNKEVAGAVLNTVVADPGNADAARQTLIAALETNGHDIYELAAALEFDATAFLSAIPATILDELMTAAAEPNSPLLQLAQFATLRQIAAPSVVGPAAAEPAARELTSKIWSAPSRNPNFTGRDEALAELNTDLIAGSTVTVYSVSGLGGVGKTQVAIEYAHSYSIVWWIPAEDATTIASHFAAQPKP